MGKDNHLQIDNRNKCSHVRNTEVIQVIRTVSFYGNGTEDNPNRFIYQYWSLDGNLLATVDKNTLDLEKESINSTVKRIGKEIRFYSKEDSENEYNEKFSDFVAKNDIVLKSHE